MSQPTRQQSSNSAMSVISLLVLTDMLMWVTWEYGKKVLRYIENNVTSVWKYIGFVVSNASVITLHQSVRFFVMNELTNVV